MMKKKLEEIDLLRITVYNERLGRLNATAEILKAQIKTATDEYNAMMTKLQGQYGVAAADQINLETGEIIVAAPPVLASVPADAEPVAADMPS